MNPDVCRNGGSHGVMGTRFWHPHPDNPHANGHGLVAYWQMGVCRTCGLWLDTNHAGAWTLLNGTGILDPTHADALLNSVITRI
jgi:hypothetical protein